jgi:hypothetical protein
MDTSLAIPNILEAEDHVTVPPTGLTKNIATCSNIINDTRIVG